MSSLAMMPWFPRDFIAATRAMRLAERGAYRELLDYQWEMGKLPREPERLARLLGVTVDEFNEIWPAIAEKFVEHDGGLINKRLEEHRLKALEQREKKRRAAEATNAKRIAKRGAVRTHSDTHSDALSDTHSDTHSDALSGTPPSPSPSKKKEEIPPGSPLTGGRARKNGIDWTTVENLDLDWWRIWLAHRRAERKPAYRTTRVAEALAKYPPEIQRAAIELSMDKGWNGLFPEKIDGTRQSSNATRNRFEEHTERLKQWLEDKIGAGE